MSGNRYFLDTNTIIALLAGDKELLALCNSSSWTGISIVSVLEYLSYARLTDLDRSLFYDFLSTSEIIPLTMDAPRLNDLVTNLRIQNRFKLPDAIVAASALYTESILVTRDTQMLKCATVAAISW